MEETVINNNNHRIDSIIKKYFECHHHVAQNCDCLKKRIELKKEIWDLIEINLLIKMNGDG